MKENIEVRALSVGGGTRQAKFSVREEDFVRMFRLVRSSLYSHKIEAVVREYASNAWDEHREAGKPDVPIQVILPTALEPTFIVRDFGRGLSEDRLYDVFGNLARSTKTEANDAMGTFGIGSKSGFAYADTYHITSWHEGKKYIVAATLDEEDNGQLTTLFAGDSDEPSGVEISVPVRGADLYEFRQVALKLFPFFQPVPDVKNLSTTLQPFTLEFPEGTPGRGPGYSGWWAWMGSNIYPIDLERVEWDVKARPVGQKGVLRFEIGEISPAPSREALQYTETTKTCVRRRLESLTKTSSKQLETEIAQLSLYMRQRRINDWLGRGLLCVHARRSYLPLVPDDWKHVYDDGSGKSKASEAPGEFSSDKIDVSQDYIVLVDSAYSGGGYYFRPRGMAGLQVKARNALADQVEPWLLAHLKSMGLEGLAIVRSSTLKTRSSRPTYYNLKHHKQLFRYTGLGGQQSSASWQILERDVEDDDLITPIERFESLDSISDYYALQHLAGEVKRSIIGVKNTAKKPFRAEDWEDFTRLRDYTQALRDRLAQDPALIADAVAARLSERGLHVMHTRNTYQYRILGSAFHQRVIEEVARRYPLLEAERSSSALIEFYVREMDRRAKAPRATLASGWESLWADEEMEEYKKAAN